MNQRNTATRRGSSMLEFALVAPLMVLLLFGTVGVGLALGRYLQALEICRDLSHMYSNGVDFSQTVNKNIAVQLAQGTGMTAAAGNGVVIFTRIGTVFQTDCDASGYSGACGNLGQAVMTQRQVVGNAALRASTFGTPGAGIVDAQGKIDPGVYLRNTDSSVRATGFTALLTAAGAVQQRGDSAYAVEVYFALPELAFLGNAPSGAYVRLIY